MLEVENIDVFHGDLQALWDVSLEAADGEMVSLIGANGAGKTTIVESISGLLTPATGNIRFNGVRLDKEPAHRVVEQGVCLIPEEKGIFPGMSVLENLELGAFTPVSRKIRNDTFGFVYDLMGQPKLLMCDEPSLGLAPLIVKNIFQVIEQINASGVSVLLVEQNVRAALGLAQRAYVIENGRVTTHGEARSLLDDERINDAYLGTG
jgi:branched-chain amino acid transport system ATP-binding protein